MATFSDKEKIENDLKQFPSSFDLDLGSLAKARVKNTIQKLEDDRKSTKKPKNEDIHITNFLSHLYSLLEDQEHALQLVDESLQKDPDNIIANANKARILQKNGEVSEVEEIISKLQELEKRNDYDKRKCYAEADLAYAYSRLGPWYHQKAVEKFSSIVEAYPTEYEWRFGLGLTLHRQTHGFISLSDDRFNSKEKEKKIVRASELFLSVATRSDDRNLCAKAYARLGNAVHDINKNRYWNVPENIRELNYQSCYEDAVAKDPGDPYVLNICGKLARYNGDIEESERFLRKSIEINPTCQGYHHLALTLTRRVEMGRGHINEGQVATKVDHSQTNQTTERKKSDSWSGFGRGHDAYRPQLRTHNVSDDPSQWNPQERGNGRMLIGRQSYQSHSYGNHGNGGRQWRRESNNNSQVGRYNTGRNGQRRASGGRYNTNRNVQTRARPDDGLHVESKESKQRNLRQVINSPLKVQVYPENQLLVEAIELLAKTKELAEYPLNIEYDKGLLYRMLGQTGKAVEVFKQIVSKRKYLPTQTLMTKVYEQLGLCLLELSESEEIPPDEKQKHKRDGQEHLRRAVQLQSGIVANDPEFKEGWHSYSTLKDLWNDKRDRKPKQLAVLHMLMGNHGDSIAIYKELSLTENGLREPEDCKNMLECYMKVGQFEECVALLSLWECTKIFASLPVSLVFDVYTNVAFHAYSTDNAQMAYKHFRCAFQVYKMFDKAITDQTEADEEEDTKDILILHSCSQDWRCEFSRNLGTILGDCTGLRYTINTEDVLGNAITLESMNSMIKKIPCVIIMTHDSDDKYNKIYVNYAVQKSTDKGGVLVVSDNKCNVPDITKTMPFIQMPPLLDDITIRPLPPLEGAKQPNNQIPDQIPAEQKEWVKEFIYLLKDQYQK